jgi:hypothetical protein
MKLIAAPTHEQGQDFVIVLVKDHVIHNAAQRAEIAAAARQLFGYRAALLGERDHGTWGPADIVRWLENVSPDRLPWREYHVNN